MNEFETRAFEMGLDYNSERGIYFYEDVHSKVMYRIIQTFSTPIEINNSFNETDKFEPPCLVLFTKKPGDDTHWRYCGIVSHRYKFIGNEILNKKLRESILDIGFPIIQENTILSHDLTTMRNEITIQNGVTSPQQGDILPLMIINNGYNGSRSQSIQFGLNIKQNNESLSFAFKLGEIKQIHITNATTTLSSDVSEYMTVFTENILDVINQSFNHTLTEDVLFLTLDVIEKISKKKRKEISKLLTESTREASNGQTPPLPTAWEVFLNIIRYSSFESNLNSKRLLENIAESVLIVPEKMLGVLEKINNQ